MLVDLSPFRSLQDFITDARFSAPTINDPERLANRIVSNLLYYQTNYFFCSVVLFLLVATFHPKDLLIGAYSSCVLALLVYEHLKKNQTESRGQSQNPLAPVGLVAVAFLFMYVVGSILVFLLGIILPVAVVLLHAATRLRNVKNKLVNVTEMFKENRTPMALLIGVLCGPEEND